MADSAFLFWRIEPGPQKGHAYAFHRSAIHRERRG
jgi:hypothetical protein